MNYPLFLDIPNGTTITLTDGDHTKENISGSRRIRLKQKAKKRNALQVRFVGNGAITINCPKIDPGGKPLLRAQVVGGMFTELKITSKPSKPKPDSSKKEPAKIAAIRTDAGLQLSFGAMRLVVRPS